MAIVSWVYIYFQTQQVVYINYVQLFLSKKLKRGMYTGENYYSNSILFGKKKIKCINARTRTMFIVYFHSF